MTHQWPQNQNQIQQINDQKSMIDSSSAASVPNNNKVMEKTDPPPPPPPQQQQLPPPPHLKCPRCDSANTKFCYYNNYSLSQPRHFCKACKRYWTRGGTLRNVPVGGGCRKNKKLRRPSSSAGGGSGGGITTSAAKHSSAQHHQQIDLSSSSSRPHASNYMMSNNNSNTSSFYPIELNFPFSSYSTNSAARVSSDNNNNTGAGLIFDLPQTHESSLGILGFSSGLNMAAAAIDEDYKNGGFSRQLIQSSSGNNNYNSVLFGSSSSTMASLLASTLEHQKFGITDSSPHPINNYDNEDNTHLSINRWNPNINNEQMMINNNSSDPAASSSSSLVWNTSSSNNNNVGSWFDPSNMAPSSSVPSLI
ncbi:hypothetical protein ABFS82_13G105400 [Erythranthe guttata]|uniref:dof zinc finger protein DOF1.4 n=1 Tax=Erythranthe guttata TaxID=4155 RepID=UPI00064DB7A5|nr:PREDICTED: dof zinc finger protein DOF1.4 [Erythranthe guttata]|eukprot:XP_012848585.1 PREDICTED: dof zinc finger protein DOF1.4 [Erythranthe guttata]